MTMFVMDGALSMVALPGCLALRPAPSCYAGVRILPVFCSPPPGKTGPGPTDVQSSASACSGRHGCLLRSRRGVDKNRGP